MTQLGSISNANPTTNITTDNIIKNTDDSFENSIDAGLKKDIENETSMEKMEKLGGPKPPKPESTMHKVGRYLTGILGGLLLAAGVAAAVAATVATCGLAGGVIAGVAATVVGTVGGTAATAVIAGAAGSAGIALITGSHVMKPRNPEALLQTQGAQGKQGAQEMQGAQGKQEMQKVTLEKLHYDETPIIANALKTKYNIVPKIIPNNSDAGDKINSIFGDIVSKLQLTDVGKDEKNIINCVKGILTSNGITEFEENEQNMLLVRHAIDNYMLNKQFLYNEDVINALNSDVKSEFNSIINHYHWKLTIEEDRNLLAIFQGAINMESVDVPKPQAQIVAQNSGEAKIAGNPMGDDSLGQIKDVSIRNQAPTLPTEIRFDAQGAKDAETAIKDIDGSKIVPYTKTAGIINKYIQAGSNDDFCRESAPFVLNVLNQNGIGDIELTPKNVLLVRHSLATYFAEWPDKEGLRILSTPEGRQKWSGVLQESISHEKDKNTRTAMAIFRAAISATDLTKLDTDASLLNEHRNEIQG